jgi:hypothetical protein
MSLRKLDLSIRVLNGDFVTGVLYQAFMAPM